MTIAPSTQVTWVYVADDERMGRELMRLAGVLAKQGILRNRTLDAMRIAEAANRLGDIVGGDIAVFLVSPAALQDRQWQLALTDGLRERGPRVLLVLMRAVNLDELPAEARRIVLPEDGVALAGRRDLDEAMLEVIGAIEEVATYIEHRPDGPRPQLGVGDRSPLPRSGEHPHGRALGGPAHRARARPWGAPHRGVPPSAAQLQYNLLSIGSEQIVVDTRCRTEINGAWKPDARWLAGAGKDPLPRYTIPR